MELLGGVGFFLGRPLGLGLVAGVAAVVFLVDVDGVLASILISFSSSSHGASETGVSRFARRFAGGGL